MTFKRQITMIFFSIFLLFNFGCKGSGTGFSGFDEVAQEGSTSLTVAPKIESWAPTTDPVSLLSSTEKTFSVTVSAGAGTVNYKFVLDGVEKQSSVSPLYTIDTSTVAVGSHSLVVTASNSKGSDSHTFTLFKNSPPTVTLNSQTSTTINCSGGTFNLSVNASDADSDTLTYTYLLNGVVNGTFLVGSSGATSTSVVFTPNCGFSGSNNIAIKVTDSKGDSTTYTVSVLVTNPFAASIDAFSPTTDPTVVLSTATTNFSITSSGNAPFQYGWVMTPGSTIASCNGLASCPIVGTDFTPGRYTLTATLTDSLPSTASKAFTVVLNQKPQVTASPSNASTINMNCANLKNFNLTINDANYGDASQTFSVSWKLNGVTNAALTGTTVLNTNPMTSQAVFSPNCNTSLLGSQTVSVVISDGHESVTYIWPLNVNYFSETCNNLTSGKICTAAGRLGLSSGIDFTTQNTLVNILPFQIERHSTNAYFIADSSRDGIWFYNNSGAAITVLGQTVANGKLKFIAGKGSFGTSAAGNVADLYFNEPRGMAYNSATGDLYVADYSNSKILKIDSAGTVTLFAGGGSSNTDADTRLNHKCNNPQDLVLDASVNKLFVTCYGNTAAADGTLKYFMTNSDNGYTLVRLNNSGSNINGTSGYSGVGRSRRAYGLSKHPNKKILFFSDLDLGQIMAVSYGDTDSFHNGAVNLGANNIVRLTPGAALGNTLNKAYTDSALRIRPYDLVPLMNGSTVEGIFFNNYNDSVVGLVNLTGSDITYGGQTIAAGIVNSVTLSGANYARGTIPAYNNTYVRNPMGMILDGSNLIIADFNNGYISKMDVSAPNTPFTDILGYEKSGAYDGETNQSLNNRRFNRPAALVYRQSNNSLYISDEDNYRVRRLNLTSGELETAMGTGSYGNANVNPTTPLNAGSQNITALHLFDSNSILLYTDFNGGNGANRNCHVRGYNFTGSDQNHFGQLMENNKVTSVAGNYALGCQTWNALDELGAPTNIALRAPYGIVTNGDESELYISDRSSNCIFKVVGSTMSSYIGTCNSAGNGDSVSGSNTIATTYKLTNPGFIKKDRHSSNVSGDSFFIVQGSRTATSEIKFVNKGASTVTINYTDVLPNEIKTVIQSLKYVSGIATYEDQICYSQGPESSGSANPHNVECINRNTGTTTIRIGRPSSTVYNAKIAELDEQEGISAGSATLSHPFDIEFDGEGNLWITDTYANSIRKVKKWF